MIFKSDGKQSDLNGFLDGGSHLQGELRFEAPSIDSLLDP